jgi:hypothetical protein
MIAVSFEHWQYTFLEDMLVKYGSSYFSRKHAGDAYADHILADAKRLSSENLTFTESQIFAGNEAFPEAAMADPLSDL